MAGIDYEQEMVGIIDVPERDRLDEAALTAWLRDHVEGFAGPVALAKFKGGQSNPTYRIDTPGRSYVLRRQPFGKLLPSAHAVDREYRVMTALGRTGFPVPRMFGLCEDATVIGSKFFVMELVDGRSLWNGAMPRASADERRALYHAMIDTLADLHLTDADPIGLADYGRSEDYCARQIARWSTQYRLSETETLPEMDRLIEWLPQTVPPQHASGIVHGDYRLDNLLFAPDAPRVAAVLDWELSTLGDPVADFAYLMLNWVNPPDGRAGIGGLDHAALGIPTMEEAVDRYVARTGYPVPPMDWYFAYNLFRLAGIMQGIKKRVIDGTASSAHARQMSERVGPLVHTAYLFARRAGLP
ncbi:phosphotransferase family protein [Erythrobacteraceae bacterium CFH 75059]|uniref:phosphotransferase family protein n=1 Tax=Qipengyuania thermophila TaxID=2509361 RepID=UPI00101F05C7|nr:phosphotransferase family protein [Qipengyuania thermophila]TCD06247.1 phosphotransferase family protein [Erythrobacteraceae bacterium CFH 75059]